MTFTDIKPIIDSYAHLFRYQRFPINKSWYYCTDELVNEVGYCKSCPFNWGEDSCYLTSSHSEDLTLSNQINDYIQSTYPEVLI